MLDRFTLRRLYLKVEQYSQDARDLGILYLEDYQQAIRQGLLPVSWHPQDS